MALGRLKTTDLTHLGVDPQHGGREGVVPEKRTQVGILGSSLESQAAIRSCVQE